MNIFTKIKDWVQRMFNFDNEKIQRDFGVKITNPANMRELISQWLEIYQGCPAWVGDGKGKISATLNTASTIINDLAIKCVSEIAIQDTSDTLLTAFWQDEIKEEIRQQLEYCLAGGSVVIRPYYDKSLNRIALSWYTAETFFPFDWTGKKCVSGIFIEQEEVVENNQTIFYTKFECHKWEYGKDGQKGSVKITIKAYKSSSPNQLTTEVPLTTLAKWADIVPYMEVNNLDAPLFIYMRTPFANNKAFNSKAGVSIFKDAVKILEDIDRTYDNLTWELDSTQHKLFLDEDMLPTTRNANGELVVNLTDKDKRLFKVMNANGSVSKYMDEYSPAIRQADITATLKTQLSLLCSNIHLDSGAYVYDEQAHAVTAREIVSKQQKTYRMITDIQEYCITPGLNKLFNTVKTLQFLYSVPAFTEEELRISYGDSILTDEETEKETAQREVSLGLRSKKNYMLEYRNMTEEEADAEIQAINSETPKTIDFFSSQNE